MPVRQVVHELLSFTRAAVVDPVARDHTEPDAAFRRRRVVAALTLVAGAVLLAWTLRIPPGDGMFYVACLALAAVWAIGALLSGPLHLGWARTRTGGLARPVVQSLTLGILILAVFLAGALVVAHIPLLRNPVERLLAHAQEGSLTAVAVLTAVNGVAEELYFRGALYAAIGRRHAVSLSTLFYALITVGPGIPLLILAAAVIGLVTALQRRVTGGVLGPIITHLVFSLGMLFCLPAALRIGA